MRMRPLGLGCFAFRVAVLWTLGFAGSHGALLQAQTDAPGKTLAEAIEIDPNAESHPLPHFWERMFGSGRAILSLRESYRSDLRETKRITGFEYVRFHAIFHDEVGLYDEDASGKPVYNFSYIDQIYDGTGCWKTRCGRLWS
jgi:xylan 1,4-beta-xylosidase